MTRQRPDQEVRHSRINKGQSSRASGTSRWSEAYHGMSAAVAEVNSEVSSNQDLSEVSSVLETTAGRHARWERRGTNGRVVSKATNRPQQQHSFSNGARSYLASQSTEPLVTQSINSFSQQRESSP